MLLSVLLFFLVLLIFVIMSVEVVGLKYWSGLVLRVFILFGVGSGDLLGMWMGLIDSVWLMSWMFSFVRNDCVIVFSVMCVVVF